MKAPTERFAAYRQALAAKVHASGAKHGKTLEAIATVPRHAFMDPGLHAQAYEDTRSVSDDTQYKAVRVLDRVHP